MKKILNSINENLNTLFNQKTLLTILLAVIFAVLIVPIVLEYSSDTTKFFDRNFESIAVGVLSSIIASIIFLKFGINFKSSHVEHSEKIFKTKKDNIHRFTFKIINFSSRPVYDLKVVVRKRIIEKDSDNTKPLLRSYDIKLLKGDIGYLARNDRYDKLKENAIQVHTLENLEEILAENENSIYFEMTFKDGYTGLQRCITKRFKGSQSIVVGEYENGNSFKVKKEK